MVADDADQVVILGPLLNGFPADRCSTMRSACRSGLLMGTRRRAVFYTTRGCGPLRSGMQ